MSGKFIRCWTQDYLAVGKSYNTWFLGKDMDGKRIPGNEKKIWKMHLKQLHIFTTVILKHQDGIKMALDTKRGGNVTNYVVTTG